MAIVMFLSTIINTTGLVGPAVTLLLTFICYGKALLFRTNVCTMLTRFGTAIAGVKQQPHASSKMLGGTGVDNVV